MITITPSVRGTGNYAIASAQGDSLPVARKCFTLLQKIFNIEPENLYSAASEASEDEDLYDPGTRT